MTGRTQQPALRHSTPIVLIGILVFISAVAYGFGDPSFERVVSQAFINIVLVVGIYIFVGNSGIISFGHIGLMMIASYMTAWQTMRVAAKQLAIPGLPDFLLHAQMPMLAATLISATSASIAALVTGLIIMRLSGVASSIATFAFLAIVNVVFSNWASVTGGMGSLVGIPTGVHVWNSGVWAALAIAIAYLHKISRYGLMLRAIRNDEVAATATGVVAFRARLIAYVVSAFVVGIAGDLFAHFLGSINPDSFYLNATFVALTMLVVGGMHSLSGAVMGVVILSAAIELLIRFEDGFNIGAVVVKLPNGMEEFLIEC
jgi:branched-chain amino acid transport system permease protein